MKQLKGEAEILNSRSMPPEIKNIVKKVCEAIGYSDPVSDVSLSDIEQEIKARLNEFTALIESEADKEKVDVIAQEIIRMTDDRNRLCKSYKK